MLWNSTYHHWSMSGLLSLHKARNTYSCTYVCYIHIYLGGYAVDWFISVCPIRKKIITAKPLFYTWSNPRILNSIDPQIINAFKTIKSSWWPSSVLTLLVHRILHSSNPYVPWLDFFHISVLFPEFHSRPYSCTITTRPGQSSFFSMKLAFKVVVATVVRNN